MPEIGWSENSKGMFARVIEVLPQFHRTIAQQLVKESAENIALSRASELVEEKDLIEAFFKEVPPAFKEMMTRLFNNLGIDYSRYLNE